jgi:predicted acylesterase/phospholipase RssA
LIVLPRLLLAALLLFAAAGCARIARLDPPPADIGDRIAILGVTNARFSADGDARDWVREAEAMVERRRAALGAAPRGRPPPANFLALSGGGDNGAFGAGLLTGWTLSSERPEFDVVTGISAGALIAPFAFLGPEYDNALRSVFVDVAPTDLVVVGRIFVSLLFSEAVADTSPLFRLISRHADEAMLRAIAREYAKGRLLLIGTTNLDVQRPVVWNIGAIAASGHPYALDLFRRILLASASIPGAFPPVFIDVEHDGRAHQEMHVDGGAATQVFLYPHALDFQAVARAWGGGRRERTVWVVRNGRFDVERTSTGRSVFSIARRSVETLLHFSGIADIDRIYLTSRRDGVSFRVAAIGADFNAPRREPFDPAYMRALFDYGVARGRDGTAWLERPPPVGVLTSEGQAASR